MKENCRKHGALPPCAACKLLRRRCAPDCVFAPYFPADEPQKFASVHKVFGASNANKMLQGFSRRLQAFINTMIGKKRKVSLLFSVGQKIVKKNGKAKKKAKASSSSFQK